MIPRLGKVRAHHFAHCDDFEYCSLETYLHKLGKYLIKRTFNESESFEITYYVDNLCKDLSKCKFSDKEICHSHRPLTYDLKKYYDTCEEEKNVNEFVADLVLKNSRNPAREPVLIEIQVSHKCTPHKIASGLRIIEIPIKTEDDIMNILSSGIKENLNYKLGYTLDKEPIGYAKFYNFKPDTISDNPLNERTVQKFYLFKSGKAHIEYKLCSEALKKDNNKAILEVCFDDSNSEIWVPYGFGYLIARNNGFIIKTCCFCKYYKKNNTGLGSFICCLYKKYGTPRYPEINKALNCNYYMEDRNVLAELKNNLPPYVVAK